MNDYVLWATNTFSCKGILYVRPDSAFVLLSCSFFFFSSRRKWKCWTGNHLPWQLKELTTLLSATLKWMLQAMTTKPMAFIYDMGPCQPTRTVLFMWSTVDIPVLGQLPALLGTWAGTWWATWHCHPCMTLTLVKKGIRSFLHFLTPSLTLDLGDRA